MKRSDISDAEILGVIARRWRWERRRSVVATVINFLHDRLPENPTPTPDVALAHKYPVKVIMAKLEQLDDRGLIEYGVSLRTAWLTEEGEAALSVAEAAAAGRQNGKH